MSNERGRIYHQQAYAQGKMLNHTGWKDILPRHITPSDFDMVFDNAGNLIFGELSSSCRLWGEVSAGQRLLYWNAVKNTRHLAILCKHSVPPEYQIDTRRDVEAFSVMYDNNGLRTKSYEGNAAWQSLISAWFNRSPDWVRDKLPDPSAQDALVDWDNVLAREEDEPTDTPIPTQETIESGEILSRIYEEHATKKCMQCNAAPTGKHPWYCNACHDYLISFKWVNENGNWYRIKA